MAVYLAVAGDVSDGVLFRAVLFVQKMSLIRFGTELSQFLRIFLPTVVSFPVVETFSLVNGVSLYIAFQYHRPIILM